MLARSDTLEGASVLHLPFAMFEKYVSSIILTLANKYIKNVNASELKLSLWGAPPPRLLRGPLCCLAAACSARRVLIAQVAR